MILSIAAAYLVGSRLGAWPNVPLHPLWATVLVVPCAIGGWRAWRWALPPMTQAAHLDHRLQLGGLLVSATEADATAWDAALTSRLHAAQARFPRLDLGALLRRVALPAALFAGVCLLPQGTRTKVQGNRSIAQALVDLEVTIELAKQEGVLPEEKLDELGRRTAELQENTHNGREATWADVDELQARLQQERALQQDALAKTAHALRALKESQRNAGPQSKSGAAADQQSQMQELLQHAAAAGLLDKLPPNVDPSRSAKAGDAEAFEQLAQALAEAALQQAQAQQGMPGEANGEALEDLAEVLRGMQGMPGGEGEGDPVAGGDFPGRGGVNRGPGHATLELNENFDGDTSAMQAHKLPPGRVLPQDWEVMQSRRVDPEVAPQRNQGAGGAVAEGAGEAAWQRRLSPSHRAVVRDFFSSKRTANDGSTEGKR